MPDLIETLKPFLKPEANIEEFGKLLPGVNPLEELKDAEKDREKATALLESNPVLKSTRDAQISKALDTYKKNTFPNELKVAVEAELKKQHPQETPEQKEKRELQERIEALEAKDKDKDSIIARQGILKDVAGKLDAAGIKSTAFSTILEKIVTEDQAQAEIMAKALIDAVNGVVKETKDTILKGTKLPFLAGGEEPLSAGDIGQQYDAAMKSGNHAEALRLAALKPKG